MTKRCLFAPIQLQPAELRAFRREHDPLEGVCPPHITFVFPFDSEHPDEMLVDHIAGVLADLPAFTVGFAPAATHRDGTVQLAITDGADTCRRLHRRLYRGPLASNLSPTRAYTPHVTIGRLRAGYGSVPAPSTVPEPALVDRFVLEPIGTDGASLPLWTFRM